MAARKTSPAKKPAAPKRTGRPSKLTPAVKDKIVTAVASGVFQDIAARYAGIDPATFYRWMEKGMDPDQPDPRYGEFREAIETAKAQSEVRSVALINAAAQRGTWQAAAWYLERSYPQRWGRYTRTEVTGKDGGPIEIDAVTLERKIAEALGEV